MRPWLIGSSRSAASNFCQFLKFWKLKLGKDCKHLWHNSYQPRETFEIHGYIMLLEIEKAAMHFCCRGWILHIPHMKYLTQELCFGLFNFFTSCMKVTQEVIILPESHTYQNPYFFMILYHSLLFNHPVEQSMYFNSLCYNNPLWVNSSIRDDKIDCSLMSVYSLVFCFLYNFHLYIFILNYWTISRSRNYLTFSHSRHWQHTLLNKYVLNERMSSCMLKCYWRWWPY